MEDDGYILHHAATMYLFTIFILKLSILGTFCLDYTNSFSVSFVLFYCKSGADYWILPQHFCITFVLHFLSFLFTFMGYFAPGFLCVSQTLWVWFVPIRSDQIRLSSITFRCILVMWRFRRLLASIILNQIEF